MTFRDSSFVVPLADVRLPAGWTFEDCLREEFWVHVAHFFQANPFTNDPDKAGARIEVQAEDLSFIAFFVVRAVRAGGLIVECIGPNVDITTGVACLPRYLGVQHVATPGYDVRWNVGKRAFDIIRQSDREVVANVKTKELAADWIAKSNMARAA